MADRNNSSQSVPAKGQQDDVRTAPEEGDPAFSGRTHGGHIIGTGGGPTRKDGSPDASGTGSGAGKQADARAKGNSGKVGEDVESGRQGTA
jgi:hypothetical protein